MSLTQIQDDSFLRALLAKLPPETSSTFTVDQLQALKLVLDAPKRVHAIDLRWTLGFWRWNFYCAFLFGRDRRELTRRQQWAERMALLTAIYLFVTVSTLFGLLVLYLIKSAMGIDIFPNFSFGIWTWFKASFL
jgi:hypothetical protein